MSAFAGCGHVVAHALGGNGPQAVASLILTDLSIYFAEQLRQVADLDIFERTHGVLDVPA
jgi:hypothetical protein